MRTVPPTEKGKYRVIASGAIANGKPVVVNSAGTVSVVSGATESLGSETVFESDTVGEGGYGTAAAFDSSNNRVIIVYQDSTNSSYGTACVGSVSGTTITFGTPTVFESTTSGTFGVDFDSSNNKVIIGYRDGSEDGHAIVGTISGTSISFGTAVVFDSGNSGNGINFLDLAFDSNENRAVIVYRDSVNQSGASTHGRAIVGTVSGTDISFGSVVTFNSGETSGCKVAFDSSNNKIVICYTDSGNSNYGTAIVGTVSGTSISFGSEVVFESAASLQTVIAFDSTNNKVVIAYRDNGNSGKGTAIVGTVSGTSISFGSAVEYEQGDVDDQAITFDSNVGKVVIAYFDGGNSNYGTYIVGTVSGTSISFGTAAVFNAGTTQYTSATFDSNENKAVIFFRDDSDSNKGKGIVLQNTVPTNLTTENYIGIATGGSYADGQSVTVDTIGTVNADQSSLTAGQQYFVQTDGTLGETADSPSVLAGTAISATELIVKE